MEVAPFESCIGCYRGDVTTFVLVEGDPDFVVAALAKLAGVSVDEAEAIAQVVFAEQGDGSFAAISLCRECARRAGAEAALVEQAQLDAGGELPAYRQPR